MMRRSCTDEKFSYKSVMQIPSLRRSSSMVGAGEARDNAKVIDAIVSDLQIRSPAVSVPCLQG